MKDFKFLQITSKDGAFRDFKFDRNGDLQYVDGPDRVKQNIVKILLTVKGRNSKYPDYGSLLQRISNIKYNKDKKSELIKESILQALTYLDIVEESDEPDEVIEQIKSMKIVPSDDPREIIIDMLIKLESGDELQISLEG